MDILHEKYRHLQDYLTSLGSVAVAFSSGVDSAFLLRAAHDCLGDKAMAIRASSYLFPAREGQEADEFCGTYGIRQLVLEADELSVPGFSENPPDRCYICKKDLFTRLKEAASSLGFSALAEGSNMDDLGDYRPGMRALKELGILSPLREAGLYKAEIRALSREMGLPTWDKPSYACLASRFVYGDTITKEKLGMVEKAEQYLIDKGFRQIRVRIHGNMARIEIPREDFPRFLDDALREEIHARLKDIGFSYVALDLLGYRTGSMNETL